VNDTLRRNLTKQGYNIVGSHSGVKLCRWTKSMLRGRHVPQQLRSLYR
jgi:tRNA wybutosine-synthesizing protein 1